VKAEKLKVHKMLYSKRYKCYGQCLKVMGFMAFMIFVKHPGIWLHCQELEENFVDNENKML